MKLWLMVAFVSAPDRSPSTTQGLYYVESDLTSHTVYLYWQKLTEWEKNGENFTYEVS